MTPVRLAILLGVALLLGAPSAAAAAGSGEFDVAGATLAPGARADGLGWSVLAMGDTPELMLTLSEVAVQRVGRAAFEVGGPAPGTFDYVDVDERASFADATVTLTAESADAIVALRSAGAGSATLSGASLRGVEGAFLAAATAGEDVDCADAAVPDYCLDVFGAYELLGDATASMSGELTLILFGPTLVLESKGETREFASGVRASQDAGAARQVEETWVVVRAREGAGSVAGASMRLYTIAPTLRADAITLHDAEGAMRVGGLQYAARGDAVEAAGALVVTLAPVVRGTENGAAGEPAYASTFGARVSGEVESINLRGAVAFLDSPAEQAGFAALLALFVAAVAYGWQHLLFGLAAFYTRLNKPDILDNDVRSHIYDIIRQNPGISAREVHRRSEQSWGTVVYHLRQLERHHLVVSRALGRTRNYYENHGKYRGMEVQLACLQSDRARVLARAIVTQPGITQEQLARASGFPQPTTSYYVRKLKQAGLIEEQRQGRYALYVPHAELPRFIALSEQTLGAPPASAAVQA